MSTIRWEELELSTSALNLQASELILIIFLPAQLPSDVFFCERSRCGRRRVKESEGERRREERSIAEYSIA